MTKFLEDECAFQTERLNVFGATNYTSKTPLANHVINIMTPKVTKSLPEGWQKLSTQNEANKWINDISKESSFLLVQLIKTEEIIGFIFLYEPDNLKTPIDIRLGYLLSESIWGNGMGSELIRGLLAWCKSSGKISSITGGVEPDNIGSVKVLTKNGFAQTNSNNENTLFYVYRIS